MLLEVYCAEEDLSGQCCASSRNILGAETGFTHYQLTDTRKSPCQIPPRDCH